MIKDIEGRSTDFVVAEDGTMMHGLAVIYVLRELDGIEEFKVIQETILNTRVQIVLSSKRALEMSSDHHSSLTPSSSNEPQSSNSNEPQPSNSNEPQSSSSKCLVEDPEQSSISNKSQPLNSNEPQPSNSNEPQASSSSALVEDLELNNKIINGFKARLGKNVIIDIETVDKIDAEKSGKFRYIISKVEVS